MQAPSRTPVQAMFAHFAAAHAALEIETDAKRESELSAEVADLSDRIIDLPTEGRWM